MTGSAFTTSSPSSSRITRSTPCVDGCCGPMLRTIVCAAPAAVSIVVVIAQIPQRGSAIPLHWVIRAQRMSLPFVRHQDAPQIGMPFETDPEEVEIFALVPVGRGPDGR